MLVKKSSAERGSLSRQGRGTRLAGRRRRLQRRGLIAFGIVLVILLGALIWVLWQSPVRIVHVQIFGADQSLAEIADTEMRGSYLGVIPRNSTLFFPADRIRADLLATHLEIAAVSLFRNGLTGLTIKIDNRIPVARWCGSDAEKDLRSNLVASGCYLFDVKGYIFATAATTTQTINPFVVYESLENANRIIGVTLPNAQEFPSAFDFARQIGTFGGKVSSIVFTNGEVNQYLASGTRITYVMGNEQNAFTALVSAKSNLNLTDGSIEYVDLRFDGKVYVKKK